VARGQFGKSGKVELPPLEGSTGELVKNTADSEDSVRAVGNSGMCKLAIAQQ
jgi:hypothetical protein